jgi:hypothetical protein
VAPSARSQGLAWSSDRKEVLDMGTFLTRPSRSSHKEAFI